MSLPDNVHNLFNVGQMSKPQYQLFQMWLSLEGSSGKMRGSATVQINELFLPGSDTHDWCVTARPCSLIKGYSGQAGLAISA